MGANLILRAVAVAGALVAMSGLHRSELLAAARDAKRTACRDGADRPFKWAFASAGAARRPHRPLDDADAQAGRVLRTFPFGARRAALGAVLLFAGGFGVSSSHTDGGLARVSIQAPTTNVGSRAIGGVIAFDARGLLEIANRVEAFATRKAQRQRRVAATLLGRVTAHPTAGDRPLRRAGHRRVPLGLVRKNGWNGARGDAGNGRGGRARRR